MHQWVQAITAGLALSSNRIFPTSKGLVKHETLDWIESIRNKYDIPGISLGIVASPNRTGHDWVTEHHGFGHMDEHGRTIDGDTLFAIASNSKLFVAMSVGLLIDNGTLLPSGQSLGYDTKVKDIYEDWSLLDPYMSEHLDVLDLLSMRSGMPRHDFSYNQDDPDNIIKRLRHLKPSTELRQVMQYNNYHYWVLAQIIPRLTNYSYIDYVKTHILDPLNMTSSTYNHTLAKGTGRRAQPYVREGKDALKCRTVWSEHKKLDRSCYGHPFASAWFTKGGDGTFIAGPGGLVSSANDMLKWLKELLEPTVLPKKVVQTTHKSFIPVLGDTAWDEVGIITYGQGQMIFNYRGHEVIQHGGDVPGFTSQVTRVPALGVGFFTAINDDDVGAALKPAMVYRILDDLLDLPPIDWEERLVTRLFQKEPSYTPIPKHPRPAPKPDQVVGTYRGDGYDTFTLTDMEHASALDESLDRATIQAIEEIMGITEGLGEPLYIATLARTFTAVMVYSHFDGSIFNATALSFNVDKHNKNKVVVNVGGQSSAVIVDGEGVGMFEDFWGGAKSTRAVEVDVKQHSEVWFDKL